MDTLIAFPTATARFRAGEPLIISCEDCVMRMTSHCQDCMVAYICEAELGPARQLSLSGEEAEAVGHLVRAGLVPELKYLRAG